MNRFQKIRKQLEDKGRYRSLALPGGIDLTSNDYLGLRAHPKLREAAIAAIESGLELGAGGSRLLRGHTEAHESLEDYAATFFGTERTLYFATGFQANYALFTTLPNRHDVVLFDSLIHASVKDGIHAGHAKSVKIPHNDLNAYEDALKNAHDSADQIWIAVESLYSMDGDFAPLAELYALAQQYEAILIVDEAHATGVWGEGGKGLAVELGTDNLIMLHTCGKALGVAGGLVCASAEIIDTIINTARPFIYSTAPMPLQAVLVQKSLEIVASEEGKSRRSSLRSICSYAKLNIGGGNALSLGGGTQIVPIVLGSDERAVVVASELQKAGFDIRAIRPPTVPEGTARLRLSLNADLDEETLQKFFDHLAPHLQDKVA